MRQVYDACIDEGNMISHRSQLRKVAVPSIALFLLFLFASTSVFSATSGTFSQDSWSGGVVASEATHPGNQNSWVTYASQDASIDVINSGADLDLGTTIRSRVQTTDADFAFNPDQFQFHTSAPDFSGTGHVATNAKITNGGVIMARTASVAPIWASSSGSQTNDIGSYASPTLVDLDNDGLLDMMIGEYGSSFVFAFRNTGTMAAPAWSLQSSWNMNQPGLSTTYMAPEAGDLDGDGDYDLLIGLADGRLLGVENTGTKFSPSWEFNSAFDGPDVTSAAHPALSDLDSDGDLDLIVGVGGGLLYAFLNGSAVSPDWSTAAPVEWAPSEDAGSFAAPALGDLNNDGLVDLVVGHSTGRFRAYQNVGTELSPAWSASLSEWAGVIDVGTNGSFSLGDVNSDGVVDQVGGSGSGHTYLRYGISDSYLVSPTIGVYESAVIDSGNHYGYSTFTFDADTTPAGTSLTVDVRAGDTPNFSDGGWTTISAVASGVDISSLTTMRYFQYVVTLSTTDAAVTPRISYAKVGYLKYAGGNNVYIEGLGEAASIDLSFSWAATSVSQYDVFSNIFGKMTYRDGYLYFADDPGNSNARFRIVDVSDPTAPVLVASTGHGHRIYDVLIEGNLAYVAVVSGIAIVDITDPTAPVTISQIPITGWTYSLAKIGNHLFMASWQTSGLVVVDVSDPYAPLFVTNIDTVGNATYVTAVNGYIYLSEGSASNGLLIYDVSDPLEPELVNSHVDGGIYGPGSVKGDILYINSSLGMRIFDVTDPAAPILLGISSLVASSYSQIDINGGFLYGVASSQARAFDISDPVSPELLMSQSGTTYNINRLTAHKNYIYAGRGGAGIEIISLGDYQPTGEYYSKVIDIGPHLGFNTLNYTALLPVGTSLAVDVRAGNTAIIDGSWTAWQSDQLDGADISVLSTLRYVQYRIRSATSAPLSTPSLNDITFNYTTYVDSASLISSPYNSTDSTNLLGGLGWSETLALPGTDVRLQIRTAADNAGSPDVWSEWRGPSGDAISYWNSANTHSGGCSGSGAISCTTLPASLRDAVNDQWVQYRVTLVSSLDTTPVVSNVSMSYDAINVAGSGIVNISAVSGSTSEPSVAATFDVVLGSAPLSNVTILLQSSDLTEAALSTSNLLFTPANWNVAQTVTITGLNDDVDDGDIAYQVLFAGAVSSDANYDDMVFPAIDMSNIDDDTTGATITIISASSTSEAGGAVTFTVRLDSEPAADVFMSLVSDDLTEGIIDIGAIEFTPLDWQTPQFLEVTGIDDVIVDTATPYSIVTTITSSADPLYAAYDPADVALTNADDDVAGVTITSIYGATTNEYGGFVPMSVKLTSMPTAPVTLMLSIDDMTEAAVMGVPTVTIFPSSWNQGVSLMVRGLDDGEHDGDIAYNIVTSEFSSADGDYDGLNPADIPMTNLDNESVTVVVTPTTDLETTESGGQATFKVKLLSAPAEDVTINFTSSDVTEGTVSPASITFPANITPSTNGTIITVTGLDDKVTDGHQPYTIQTTLVSSDAGYGLIDPDDVDVTNLDNNRTLVTLDPDVYNGKHGTAVTLADTNCDGIDDLVVGGDHALRGDLSVYYGNGNGFSTERDQRIYTIGSDFASAVVNLGDVNGDGCDDIAVGEFGYSVRGRVHIYYGSATGFSDLDSDGLTEAADAALFFNSTGSSSQFGSSLVADDFDGDGDMDLVISAPLFDSDTSNEGRVFLYKNYAAEWTVTYGADRALWPVGYRADGWLDPDNNGTIEVITEATWDWAFEADLASVQLGGGPGSLASVNVNGDAYRDLVIGARLFDNGSVDEGRVFLFHGSASGFDVVGVDKIAHTSDANWVAESDLFRGYLGSSLADAGDIDGDGFGDLLVGAGQYSTWSGSSYEGAVFLFKGSATGLVTAADADGIVRAATESDQMLIGPYVGATYGYSSIAGIGDFDGDGYPDVAIGGTGSNPTYTIGGVYVHLNDRLGGLETTAVFSDKDRQVWGNFDALGTMVGSLGDVNGDGLSDIYASGINVEDSSSEGNEGTVFLYISNVQAPGVTVTPSTGLQTDENGGTATFTVVLDAPFTAETDTLSIAVSSLMTTEGTVSPALLSFDINDWHVPQTVTITGENDLLSDGAIPYVIDLATVVTTDASYVGIDPVNVDVTNYDNDVAVAVVVSSVSATEGETGYVRFMRSGEITDPLTVDYSVAGTASGSDFSGLGASVVIPAGAVSVDVNVSATNDGLVESDETVVLSLLTGAGYTPGIPASTTLTIYDNDVASIVVSPASTLVTTESGGRMSFSMMLTSQPDVDVTIGLSSSNVGEGVVTPNQFIFTPGNWGVQQVGTVIGVDDGNTVDADVDYSIVTAAAIADGDTYYNGMNAVDVAVVNRDNDNGAIPRVTLSATNPTVNEAGAAGLFTVSRSGLTTDSLRVFYSAAGTAWPGGDYQALTGAVDIAAGSSSAVVGITPINDALVEGDETIVVTLARSSGYIIDHPSRETIIMVDDEQDAQPPFANFWIDQSVGEGGAVTVGVELSAPALSYPVTIPYTVSGSASYPIDHDAIDNDIVIASGTSGSVTVNIQDDGAGDAGETIVFTMGTLANAREGLRNTHTITTIELNEAAEVTLSAVQNGQNTRLLVRADGYVTVSALVTDPNPTDTHSYSWSATNAILATREVVDADDTTYVFNPAQLANGFYKVRLTTTDNGTPNISVDSELLIELVTVAPVLTSADSDNDGVIDSDESFADSDGDGVPDYLDAAALMANELQLFAAQNASYIMRTEVGLTLRLGDVAFAAESDGAYVTSGDISAYGGGEGNPGAVTDPDTVPNAGGGYVDFEITGLPNAGQSVMLTIPQMEALPINAVYRKYHPVDGWKDYVEDASNSIASAPGSPGDCPSPGSAAYTAGLTAGHYCVQLTIQDGGGNDMDGQANRVIKDPAQIAKAVAVSEQEAAPASGGGGSLHPLWQLLLLSLFWLNAAHHRKVRLKAC